MPKPQKPFKVIKVKATVVNKKMLLELPASLIKYLNLGTRLSMFAVPVNGVVQLSAEIPNVAIPVTKLTEDDFITQAEL